MWRVGSWELGVCGPTLCKPPTRRRSAGPGIGLAVVVCRPGVFGRGGAVSRQIPPGRGRRDDTLSTGRTAGRQRTRHGDECDGTGTGSSSRQAPRHPPRRGARPVRRRWRRFRNGRSFACCPATDQIAVIDAFGRLCEVFGEAGQGPGQFDQPSHVIVVSPRFEGEDVRVEGIALVAVADRGNNRVQVFEPEGQLLAIIGAPADSTAIATEWRDARAGWPFFRVGGDPRLEAPVRLEWADPLLVVVGADGSRTPIDLAAALLPSFDAWLATASRPMLAAAHHHFRHKVRSDMLAAPLAAIETALGIAALEAGDADAAARLVEPELAGGARASGAGSPRRRPRSRGDGGGVPAGRGRAGGRGARRDPSESRRVRAARAQRRRSRRSGPASSFRGGVSRPATDLVVSFAPPDIGDDEMRAVVEVLQSGWLTTGPKVKAFERAFADYTGAPHAIARQLGHRRPAPLAARRRHRPRPRSGHHAADVLRDRQRHHPRRRHAAALPTSTSTTLNLDPGRGRRRDDAAHARRCCRCTSRDARSTLVAPRRHRRAARPDADRGCGALRRAPPAARHDRRRPPTSPASASTPTKNSPPARAAWSRPHRDDWAAVASRSCVAARHEPRRVGALRAGRRRAVRRRRCRASSTT